MKTPLHFTAKIIVLFIALAHFASCSKTGSLKVNVKFKEPGQSEQIAVGDVVLVQNASNINDFEGGDVPASGTLVFDDLKAATYKVSAQHAVISGFLYDEEFVTIRKGSSEEVNLLLE